MSYDLDIATRRRPGRLEPLLDRLGVRARLEGAFEPERNVLVTRLDPERTIDIDGPGPVEREDLDDRFAASAPRARWLAGIHLPGGYAENDDGWVVDLAIELAREYGGAVWDPQAERVLWPEGGATPRPRRHTARPAPREMTARLLLNWFVPRSRLGPAAPGLWLGSLREWLPDALPGRFGLTEPYTHRLERDGDGAFSDDWARAADGRRIGLLTWNGTARDMNGMAYFKLGEGRLAPVLELGIDAGDTALSDEAMADRIAALVAATADALDAVYAEAHVEPTEREVSSSGSIVSPFRHVVANGWAGLPWDPTWLAWFGRPYADRLRPELSDWIDRATARGFMIRFGALPMGREELRAVFPALPPALVQYEHFYDPSTGGPAVGRLAPAIEIPPLDGS